jgi:hypothetical protein
MKKYILGIFSLLLGMQLMAKDLRQQRNTPLDSLLNLQYNQSTYTQIHSEIWKYSQSQAQQIGTAVAFVQNLPACWAMSPVYKSRMNTMYYKQLHGYYLLVAQEYGVFERIESQFPIEPKDDPAMYIVDKPVIYLYPLTEQKITVNLGFNGTELYTWPKIDAGQSWTITAQPNGMLKDKAGEEYPYLFWEGKMDAFASTDMSTGFVVKADETETFLRDKLKLLGLNAREYTDFITFWGPRMHKNKYNLIHFETAIYIDKVPLNVTPKPESSQRILMVYQGLENPVEVKPQVLQPFTRKGFTLIEWGGTELPKIVN